MCKGKIKISAQSAKWIYHRDGSTGAQNCKNTYVKILQAKLTAGSAGDPEQDSYGCGNLQRWGKKWAPTDPLVTQISAHQEHSNPPGSKWSLLFQFSHDSCTFKLKLIIIFPLFWILRPCLYFNFHVPHTKQFLTAKLCVTKGKNTR